MKHLALLLLLFASPVWAQIGPEASVVRLTSHGGSGTVIATGPDWSLILSCAHCFEGRDASKPITIDVPHYAPTGPQKVGIKLVSVGRTSQCDLSLLRVGCRLPYVTPVAPVGYQSDAACWSIGYDELKLPPQKRPAKIVRVDSQSTLTDSRPWHGRSGGALVEKRGNFLVGVVSAYTGPSNHAEYHPGANGVHVSHRSIIWFLTKAGVIQGQSQDYQPEPAPQYRPQPFLQPSPFGGRGSPNCPT